jgi:cobalt-zinc-cadmium efflux system protein
MVRLYVAFCLVLAFAFVEFLGAYFSHSLSLASDGIHMITDTWGLGLAVFVSLLARKKRTDSARLQTESRGAHLSMSVLALVALGIMGYAAWRLFHPAPVIPSRMLLVAFVGLAINLGVLFLLWQGRKKSDNVAAAYFHIVSDTLTSLGVIGAALAISASGKDAIDPVVSIGIGVVVFLGAVHRSCSSTKKLQKLKEQEARTVF